MYDGGVDGKVKNGTPVACIRQGYVLKLCDICHESKLGKMAGEVPAAAAATTWCCIGG